ncbi:nuclear transport factor 2 family protein [Ferrimonas aestuarii]|uniref:Nuclear transport factor 2 family protein n=1 Tax=Ferrimonas aestuarii TaxID=2569539 RepID=A0A4U1BRZ9_9GAMM|nr:nuclear transport factor 2 family protein [Ferrimonas aestuarii]TKB57634.1 nuclear transport factor 2 family protein [Ferrimonas aestuarii]
MSNLQAWTTLLTNRDVAQLDRLLADDATFHSPVVHTPQQGKAVTKAYLTAAFHLLLNDEFRYLKKIDGGDQLALEFQTVIDGITINGIDIISFNDNGQISEFKVMLRPLKAVNLVHQKMGELLAAMSS